MTLEKPYSPDTPIQKNNTPVSERKKYEKPSTNNLQKQEQLAKEIEKPSDNRYGLDELYAGMTSDQQTEFIKNLSSRGVTAKNLNVGGMRCNVISIIGKDGEVIKAAVDTINYTISFPSQTRCGTQGELPTMEDFLFVFNTTNKFPHQPKKLESAELQNLGNQIMTTSAKSFFENGDSKLFNKAHEYYSSLPDEIKKNILGKIQELYANEMIEIKTATVSSIKTTVGDENSRVFRIGNVDIYFGK